MTGVRQANRFIERDKLAGSSQPATARTGLNPLTMSHTDTAS